MYEIRRPSLSSAERQLSRAINAMQKEHGPSYTIGVLIAIAQDYQLSHYLALAQKPEGLPFQ